jgi:transposase
VKLKLDQHQRIELTLEQLEALLAEIKERLEPEQFEIVQAMAETIRLLSQAVEQKSTSIARLLKMMFGSGSEKTRQVLDQVLQAAGVDGDDKSADPGEQSTAPAGAADKKPKPGHGRNGAAQYRGAQRIAVALASPRPGQHCPQCGKGTLYPLSEPSRILRVVGQAPLQARIYELERARCGLCGKVFTATAPAEARGPKYDESAGAMVALLKYGAGVPFNRLAGLQESLELPLPAATQWEIVEGVADQVYPAVRELWRQGAQGEVVHNDDTTMKILELMAGRKHNELPPPGEAREEDAIVRTGESAGQDAAAQKQTPPAGADGPPAETEPAPPPNEKTPSRTGVFTSAIISRAAGHTIALFATGARHAGENLERLLELREREREHPIQMCDALSRNVPKSFQTLLANCLAHGRRRFVDVVASFPEECRRVLLTLREVYRHDAHCREQGLSPPERLAWHQQHSGPLMQELRAWMAAQLAERLVEPNSGLGEAMRYTLKHWQALTLFLRAPGAPLDNNVCEQALKMAIRSRKNSLFYKTEHGAHVGDLFMSLIHTCQLNCVNPFAYLVQLQRHSAELRRNPAAWMPWNYQMALAALEPAPVTPAS